MEKEYCDEHPEAVDPHSAAPALPISQSIGAEVDLHCAKGYEGKDEKLLSVECREQKKKTRQNSSRKVSTLN